jgi:hypothetical protein
MPSSRGQGTEHNLAQNQCLALEHGYSHPSKQKRVMIGLPHPLDRNEETEAQRQRDFPGTHRGLVAPTGLQLSLPVPLTHSWCLLPYKRVCVCVCVCVCTGHVESVST